MSRRTLSLLALAIVAAAVCVRLGVWQLSRLQQRRARNAAVAARLHQPPVAIAALPPDTAERHFRRVTIAGVPLYDREFVLANRTHDGSPGVNIITPVRMAGRDTLVLVNRGWVYSGNGTAVDLARWHEGDSLRVEAYVELPSRRPGTARLAQSRAYRWLDPREVARDVGAPVTDWYAVAEAPPGETKPPLDRPVRLAAPALDEGPHLSYAIQWFSFALVALVGGAAFVRAERRRERAPATRTAA